MPLKRLGTTELDHISEDGNMVLHEKIYIRKMNLQKTLEIAEIQRK